MKRFLPYVVCNIISQRDLDVTEHLPEKNERLNKGENSPPEGEGGVFGKAQVRKEKALRPVVSHSVKLGVRW